MSARRSPSVANVSPASAAAGRHANTRSEFCSAASTAASHNVVLPIPASPSIARPFGPVRSTSTKAAIASSSSSRPATSALPIMRS